MAGEVFGILHGLDPWIYGQGCFGKEMKQGPKSFDSPEMQGNHQIFINSNEIFLQEENTHSSLKLLVWKASLEGRLPVWGLAGGRISCSSEL